MAQTPERKLAVLLHADIVGSTLLVRNNETLAHGCIQDTFQRFSEVISNHGGTAHEIRGDALVAEFSRASDAVSAALEFQFVNIAHNEEITGEIRPVLRIGVAMGEVVVADNTVTGEGIVLAQRLEQLAEPGGVCVQAAAYETMPKRLPFDYENLGEKELKGFSEPVRVYAVTQNFQTTQSESNVPIQHETVALEIPDKPSIAVLPFTNLSGESEQEYFADGIVEGITAALSRIKTFFVIARTSAFIFRDKAVSFKEVRKILGVRYFLEGSVQKAVDSVRITVQLIETATGAHVWAEKYDGTLSDIFDLQDNIIEQVAGALQPNIRQAEIERSRRKRPNDLGAYDFVMQALPYVWSLNRDNNLEALRLLNEAIKIDTKYPVALALAAWCHAQQVSYNWSTNLDIKKQEALDLANQAASLNVDDPLVLTALGAAHTLIKQRDIGRTLIERAVLLDPNSAWAWNRLGWSKVYDEKPKEAIGHFETTLRLSPYDPMNFNCYIGMGSAYAVLGDFNKAIVNFERGLNENPQAIWAYRLLIAVYAEVGRKEDAQAGVKILLQTYPELTTQKVREAMAWPESKLNWICKNLLIAGLPE